MEKTNSIFWIMTAAWTLSVVPLAIWYGETTQLANINAPFYLAGIISSALGCAFLIFGGFLHDKFTREMPTQEEQPAPVETEKVE